LPRRRRDLPSPCLGLERRVEPASIGGVDVDAGGGTVGLEAVIWNLMQSAQSLPTNFPLNFYLDTADFPQ
jgi:hypothetical protein